MYESKDKRFKLYKIILDYCKIKKYKINITSNDNLKWIIYNNELKIGEIKYTKSKVNLLLNDYPINIDIISEKDIRILDKIL